MPAPPAYGLPAQPVVAAPPAMPMTPQLPLAPMLPQTPVMPPAPQPALTRPPNQNVILYVILGGLFVMALFVVIFFALKV
jgi:hypothetical protein